MSPAEAHRRGRPAHRPGPVAILLALAAWLPAGLPAQVPEGEQALTGRVVEAGSGNGIEGAIIEVFDEEGERVAVALTGEGSRFRVPVVRPGGPFVLEVFAMNHHRGRVDSIHVRLDEIVELDEIVLEIAPIDIDSLRVEVQGKLTGRERVRRRQALGKGTFFAGAALREKVPYYLSSYLAEKTGLMVRFGARSRSVSLVNPRSIRRCMTVHVNDWPIGRTGFRSLDEIPLDMIAAVEVYDTWDDTPEDARMMRNTDWSGCGLVNVWLWNSW